MNINTNPTAQNTSQFLSGRTTSAGLVVASKYGSIRSQVGISEKRPNIRISQRRISFWEWWNREMKEGGCLQKYLAHERATGPESLLQMARKFWKREQNKRSDFRLRCVLPKRQYMRLKAMDKDFFADDVNLRNLIRDTPEVAPWKK